MRKRIKDSYQLLLYDFIAFDILVVCPHCSQKAVVKSRGFRKAIQESAEIKVICVNCGYNKQLSTPTTITVGNAIDPFFQLPLWLQTDFEGKVVWAYNTEHLTFLRSHITAKLRERNGLPFRNKSLGSRLPQWITASKHRGRILKKIEVLEIKI
jgi:transcription elongation factor Elf1